MSPDSAGKVSAIPSGYHTFTPYLYIDGADQAIQFYGKAFHAKEVFRMHDDKGRVAHAEIQIGDSRLMLSDEHQEIGAYGPRHYGGTTVGLLLYVEDVDALHAQAVAAGAKEVRKPTDQPYGDRMSCVVDPFGHNWYLATHIEDVSAEEIKRRMQRK
ncbi:MAG TPA: VOC family protein [Acidisarcina sp.]|nr:VOC family protein [Acidisarcina sp.]